MINEKLLRPTILYNSSTGSTGNITLDDNIENYSYYEIYFSRGDSYNNLRMTTDFKTNAILLTSMWAGNIARIYMSSISISGKNLTRNYSRYINIPDSGTSINCGSDNITIYRVIGYK